MGAIGNYEVISEPFNFSTGLNGEEVTVDVPVGKVALGWGAKQTPVSGNLNRDLVVNGRPASDGSSVTFQFYEAQSGTGASGDLYVTCAEMGC